MGATLLPDLGTEILIPICAVIGIGFSLFQWFLVSQVKLLPARDSHSNNNNNNKNGYADSLIEEEEGLNDHNIVLKCAEIQNAISEGPSSLSLYLFGVCLAFELFIIILALTLSSQIRRRFVLFMFFIYLVFVLVSFP